MIVEKISSASRNTKYGVKMAWSFKADGEWYQCGFKKPSFQEGDSIDITVVTPTTYGNQVDLSDVKLVAPTPSVGMAAPASKPRSAFPIAPTDGQISIVRQNALTNAREVYVSSCGGKAFAVDNKVLSEQIIDLAKHFEEYTSGNEPKGE